MNEDVKAMVEAIDRAVEDGSYELTDWEEGFLKSVKRLVSEGMKISDKQDQVLERIWNKATR